MASKRQINVGGVPIGGGAPVAVQSMTKTETADFEATMRQIHAVAEAGGDLVRCAVPRDEDVEALRRIVVESPIPVIADIHFNHTLALKAIDAGALPRHLHELERESPVEALVTAAVEFVELMERLDFENFKVSIKSTSVPDTIASNRLLSEKIDYPLDLPRRGGGQGAWEILKALKLRERGPVLIACPTCGRLQFDMDSVVAEIERRLEAYPDPIEVAVLGCAVNGIGEASHADFGITGAKNEGLIFSRGKALKKVPQNQLVDELFKEIDKYVSTKRIDIDAVEQAAGAEWLQRIEEENAGELTPERLAKLEAEKQRAEADAMEDALLRLDETASPTAGRRFTR